MTHEFDGKKYAKASSHQKEWGIKLISELSLNGNERVLDLGCGDGALTSRIAELVPEGEVMGIDASQGMIEAARPKERSNLHFRILDINGLEFENRFDIIFSNAALHWVKDHHRLLQNVRRALRPNGRIRFNFAGKENCSNFLAVAREAMAREEFAAFFTAFEWPWYMPAVQEYRELAASSGFHHVEVRGENADRFFPDTETMIRWIDQPSLVPFLASVPGPMKDAFREFVVARMIERTRQEDGRCFETFRRIDISACRSSAG